MDNVLLASDGVPSAGFLIRQTLEGEALGIAVLERILRELQINRSSVKLVNAVQRQLRKLGLQHCHHDAIYVFEATGVMVPVSSSKAMGLAFRHGEGTRSKLAVVAITSPLVA
jgi:hypothetical protein